MVVYGGDIGFGDVGEGVVMVQGGYVFGQVGGVLELVIGGG